MSFLWFLSEGRNAFLDFFMLLISYIGTPFCVVGIIIWFYYNVNKKAAYGISFAFFTSTLFCQGLKLVVRMPVTMTNLIFLLLSQNQKSPRNLTSGSRRTCSFS